MQPALAQIFLGIPTHAEESAVCVRDPSIRGEKHHTDRFDFEGLAQPGFAVAQFIFGLLPPGDVDEGRDHPCDAIFRRPVRPHPHQIPALGFQAHFAFDHSEVFQDFLRVLE